MNTVHTLLDNVSLHCGVEESISRYPCSRGGQVERKTNSVGFYHQSVLEIDNSHTDLILGTAFCGCQPSHTPSLSLLPLFCCVFPWALFFLPIFLFLSFSFNCKPIWSMFVFTLSLSFSISTSLSFSLAFPLLPHPHTCVCA